MTHSISPSSLPEFPGCREAEEIFSYNRLRDVSDTRALPYQYQSPKAETLLSLSSQVTLCVCVCVIKRYVSLRPCMHAALRLDRSWTRNPS